MTGQQPEDAQMEEYCRRSNCAIANSQLSPTGRVPTAGTLRQAATDAARQERAAAAAAGQPYAGHVGHVPDTTWTGRPDPVSWMDLSPRINASLGGQAGRYPIGFTPTEFILEQ
jgi:hypothetical protein